MLRFDVRGDRLDSLEAFRRQATAWDDLWLRCTGTRPAMRAASIAAWLRGFARDHVVQVPVVRGPDGRLLAGLVLQGPLRCRWGWPAGLINNCWNPEVGLLWDPRAPIGPTAARLAEQILGCRLPVLRLLDVPSQGEPWPSLLAALRDHSADVVVTASGGNVVLDLSEGLMASERNMSSGLRKRLRKTRRLLAEQGAIDVRVESPEDPDNARRSIERALEIEHAGWKGDSGSSVKSVPEAYQYFVDLAVDAASCGTLRISFLEVGGTPIAFEIGTVAGPVYHSTKVGYDEAFAEYSPGHLLMESLVGHFVEQGVLQFDCLSSMTPTLQRWGPTVQPRSRVLVTRPGWTGRTIATAYRFAYRSKQRFRPSLSATTVQDG